MKIMPVSEPYKLSKSRRVQAEALAALHELLREPDLLRQAQGARQKIVFGDVETWWANPVSPGMSPYVSTMSGGAHRLLITNGEKMDVAIYEGGTDLWRRCIVTRRPEIILASLPRRALAPPLPDAEATTRQLSTLRKLLDLAPDKALPKLHAMAVSRIIERFVVERTLPELIDDFTLWLEATLDEHAA